MDPVTILSLISGAGSVGKLLFQSGESLYKLIERARDVDQTIRGLHRETKGLGQTVIAIKDALEQPAIKCHQTIRQDYALVWATLDNSIHDCEETAKAMRGKFESAQSAKTSFLSQAWRQYKLGLKEEEIRDLRSQIHTHGSRLQQSLQMISVIASITSPERVIESIGPRIDHLITLVQSQPSTQPSSSHDAIEDLLAQQRMHQLHNAAQVVISSASAIIGDSRSTINGGSIYERTSGSQFGTPLDSIQTERIHGWIAPPVINEEDARSHSSSDGLGSSQRRVSSTKSSSAPPRKEKPRKKRPPLKHAPSSTIKKLEKETIRRLMEEGKKLLESEKFSDAARLFEQSLERMKKIADTKVDEGKCRLLLAISLLDIGQWTPQRGFTFTQRGLKSMAGHAHSLEPTPVKTGPVLVMCKSLVEDSLKLLRSTSSYTDEYYRLMATYAKCCIFWQMNLHDKAYDLCRETVSILRVNKFVVFLQLKEKTNALGPFLGLLSKMCSLRGDEGEAGIYDDMWIELKHSQPIRPDVDESRRRSRTETKPIEVDESRRRSRTKKTPLKLMSGRTLNLDSKRS